MLFKTIRTIFFFMVLPVFLNAQVDIGLIKRVGNKYLLQKEVSVKNKMTNTTTKSIDYSVFSESLIKPIVDPENENIILAYVFELKPKGYIVIPNNKDITPILAHSFSHNFNWEVEPNNILYGMIVTDLQNRTRALNDGIYENKKILNNNNLWNKYKSNEDLMGVTEAYPSSTSGWLSTSWSQGWPFNISCPQDPNTNDICVTGCVSTAMGQIVNYWGEKINYPQSVTFTTGDSYTSKIDPDDGAGERTISINKIDADISNINYNSPSFDEISDLLFACGVAVEMDYSSGGSSAHTSDVTDALKDIFNYNNQAEKKDGDDLLNLLDDNMKNGVPAQLAISIVEYNWLGFPKDKNGHSIVCDGLKVENSKELYHLNFGWGNTNDDAWYELPSGMPAQYNNVRYGIVNILPKSEIVEIDASNLTVGEWGLVNIKIIAPKTDEFYIRAWDDDGITYPEWEWQNYSSNIKSLKIGKEQTFTLYVKPDDTTEKFEFWLYQKSLLGIYKIIHKVEITFYAKTKNNGIDVALVLDKSGSMIFPENQYMEPAKDAASTFVGLMQTGDNVAVISFESSATVDFPLTQIISDATKTEAQNAISQIYAGGGTGIGNGIQTAQSELNKGNTSIHQGLVLLSDGFESGRYPTVADVLPNIPQNTDIYTIALGPNSDQVLLKNTATQTGAFYSYAPTTDQLQNIYNAIRAGVSGQQVVKSSVGKINQSQTVSEVVSIDNSIINATFSVTWAGSDIDLTLIDPNGNPIDTTNIQSVNGTYSIGSTYEYFTIPNPIPGEWKIQITGVNIPTQDYEYATSVTVNTNLILTTDFDQLIYGNGWPIIISAEVMENNNPTTGATLTAEVTTPVNPLPASKTISEIEILEKNSTNETQSSNSSFSLYKDGKNYYGTDGVLYYANELIQLFDDGQHNDKNANDGIYAATYTNTAQAGSYTFKVMAEGNNSSNQKFTRLSTQATVVDPVKTPSIPNLYSPSDGSKISLVANCVWYASINAGTYILQVSEDTTFSTIFFEESSIADTHKVVSNYEKNKTYYWRVMATNSSGSSAWSQIWSFNTFGYDKKKIKYSISVEATCLTTPYQTQTNEIYTDENFIVEQFAMPEFAKNWQIIYDAFVGVKFVIEEGAIDENIILDIRLQQLDCENPGTYLDPSNSHNPLFLFLGIKVTGEQSGVTELEDYYYFKNNKHAKIYFPHNPGFLKLLSNLNFTNIDSLDFAYYLTGKYFKDGISSFMVSGNNGEVDSTCVILEHFSQIAGGKFAKITDVDEQLLDLPTEYSLEQNYPNPFNPTTTIRYSVPEANHISLKVFDVLGNEVQTILEENQSAGNYNVKFDAGNLTSGIYFYRLQAGEFVETKKLLLMK